MTGDRRPQFFSLSGSRARSMSCRARKSAPVSARTVRPDGDGVSCPGTSAAVLVSFSMNSRVRGCGLDLVLELVAQRKAGAADRGCCQAERGDQVAQVWQVADKRLEASW